MVSRLSIYSQRFLVFKDGRVCISILHPPGTDAYNEQESADERWRPIIGVEAIIMSVISMLGEPNPDSPANVEAAVGNFHNLFTSYRFFSGKTLENSARKSDNSSKPVSKYILNQRHIVS